MLYSSKETNLTPDDIYVGEELNNQLLPVKDDLLSKLEKKFEEIISYLLSNQITEEL